MVWYLFDGADGHLFGENSLKKGGITAEKNGLNPHL